MTVVNTDYLKNHPVTKQEAQLPEVAQSTQRNILLRSFDNLMIMGMEATTLSHQKPMEETLPNWKLKANWLMRKIAYAWYGFEPVQNYLDGQNFLSYFSEIIIQYLVDIDESKERTKDMARNVLYYCTFRQKEMSYVRHGIAPSFTLPADEAEWIMEAVCLHVKRFDLMSEEMIWIINTARILQSLLKVYNRRPVDGLITILPLSYYENLPHLPIL